MSRPNWKLLVVAFAALALTAAIAGDVRAQSRSGVGSQRNNQSLRQGYQGGAGGQRLPFSTGGARGGYQAGFGSRQNAGGVGRGMGAGAGSGVGGGVGEGAVGDGPLSAGLAQGGAERFQEGGFVGRDAEDVRAGFDSLSGGRGPGGMMDQMIENLNEMRESRRRWREQNSAPPPIRVRLVPAFDMPANVSAPTSVEIQTRLTRVMQSRSVGSPQVEFVGRTAFLRGVVATERERALLGKIASLEPGVSKVENLVTIQGPPAAPVVTQ
jgi:hypothetical protein